MTSASGSTSGGGGVTVGSDDILDFFLVTHCRDAMHCAHQHTHEPLDTGAMHRVLTAGELLNR